MDFSFTTEYTELREFTEVVSTTKTGIIHDFTLFAVFDILKRESRFSSHDTVIEDCRHILTRLDWDTYIKMVAHQIFLPYTTFLELSC